MHYMPFGGAPSRCFAALYYWFPKMTGRMLTESLGKVSFWLVFIGFHVTFLIQHSAGLSGMPRRDLRVPADSGWHDVQPRSRRSARSCSRSASLRDGRQRRAVAASSGPSPGPTRGRPTRSSGSRPRRRPSNNFDVIPRVRSVEPMKDIRRQVEQLAGAAAALRGRPPDGRRAERRCRRRHPCAAARAPPRCGGRPAGRGRLRRADEAEGPVLLLLTTVTTMYVAGDPSVELVALDAASAARCRPAARARSTTGTTATSTPRWRARPTRPVPSGPDRAAARRWRSASRSARCRSSCCSRGGQPARRVLALCGLPRLRRSSTRSG